MDRASAILRDNFNEEYVKITVDDEELADDMREYLNVIAPEKANIVKTVTKSNIPLFEQEESKDKLNFPLGKTLPYLNHVVLIWSSNIQKHYML